MLKHIKLFEQYNTNEDAILNSIYENWKGSLSEDLVSLLEGKINEADYFETEGELSPGERRALAREMQIISKPQLAALYLFALGKEEGEPFKYIFRIPGMLDFADQDNAGNPTITYAAFADAIGLESMTTVSRTMNKFKNLISGIGETPGEVVYPKVVQAFEAFQGMNTDSLAAEAGETIQDALIFTKNREAAAAMATKGAAAREAEKKNALNYGFMIYKLIDQLRRNPLFSDLRKAQNTAIRKIAGESNIPETKLLDYYAAYLRDKGILNRQYYVG